MPVSLELVPERILACVGLVVMYDVLDSLSSRPMEWRIGRMLVGLVLVKMRSSTKRR